MTKNIRSHRLLSLGLAALLGLTAPAVCGQELSPTANPSTATVSQGELYQLDPDHSFISFRISHLGFSILQGRFNTLRGQFRYNEKDPASASIQVTVETNSIDSNHAKRDAHLRGKNFLDVESFPTATFTSHAFQPQGEGGDLSGDLTLHGVTKRVVIPVKTVGAGTDPWGGFRRGFRGTLTLQRGDYDLRYNLGPAADTVELELLIEGVLQR
ncbi:MAG: YceI family protein [Magnetococcus sp. MYC-9]